MGVSNKLKVTINSFSYKRGIPYDATGNGGGFVFDCRGLENPGRYESFTFMTGQDQEVVDFLEEKSRVSEFLEHALALADVNISNYLTRGFNNLVIGFGCTGGQHRSVYCAEKFTQLLQRKFSGKIMVECNHLDIPDL
ncbi:MAG: ATP-binding protein [Bacteroidales bacterium]